MRGVLVKSMALFVVLACTACGELRSTFPCGPDAYTDGPVGRNHQPMVANTCPSQSNAEWAGPTR